LGLSLRLRLRTDCRRLRIGMWGIMEWSDGDRKVPCLTLECKRFTKNSSVILSKDSRIKSIYSF